MQQTAAESGHAPRSAVLPRLLHHGRSLPSVAWLLIGIALLALLLVPPRPLAVDTGSGGDAHLLAHFCIVPPTGTPQFVLSGYTHREDAARLSTALGKPLQPIASRPDLPGRNEPAFVVYAPEP